MSAPKMSTLKTSYPKMLTFVTVLELTLDKSGTSSNQTAVPTNFILAL